MEPKKLNPAAGAEDLDSYRDQKALDARKSELDALPAPTECEMVERLFLDAVSCWQPVLFSLPDGGPTIEQIKSDIPELSVTAQIGKSYAVAMPANDESLGKFVQLYGNLPDPVAEDLPLLQQAVEARDAGALIVLSDEAVDASQTGGQNPLPIPGATPEKK